MPRCHRRTGTLDPLHSQHELRAEYTGNRPAQHRLMPARPFTLASVSQLHRAVSLKGGKRRKRMCGLQQDVTIGIGMYRCARPFCQRRTPARVRQPAGAGALPTCKCFGSAAASTCAPSPLRMIRDAQSRQSKWQLGGAQRSKSWEHGVTHLQALTSLQHRGRVLASRERSPLSSSRRRAPSGRWRCAFRRQRRGG